MKFFSSLDDLTSGAPVVLCIGFFDGVHLGHQAVVRAARNLADAKQAACWVLTFANHPATILRPQKAPALLTTNETKQSLISELGADALLMPPFTPELSRLSPEDFFKELRRVMPELRAICIGHNWRFGKDAAGCANTLTRLAEGTGIDITVVDSVSLQQKAISSTRIRNALMKGRLSEVADMLGRQWQFSGEVISGSQVGAQLGFPTANIQIQDNILLPKGVFAAMAECSGELYQAVLNIGARPTIHADGPVTPEVHLLDTEGHFYGENMTVFPVKKLREESRFDSREALSNQIRTDIEDARAVLEPITENAPREA